MPDPAPPALAFVEKTITLGRDLLRRGLESLKGKILEETDIGIAWVEAYAIISERVERDRRVGITRYKFEAGAPIVAMAGEFFDHKEWPLRKALAQHPSMRAVAEHEAKYINCAGYWLMSNESALMLRMEKGKNDESVVQRFDVWAFLASQYSLRCLGLRTQFYGKTVEDPTYAKLVIPALEKKSLNKRMPTTSTNLWRTWSPIGVLN